MKTNIFSINGPVVTIKGETPFEMYEMVYVGHNRLMGEVISLSSEACVIQVYESTTSLAPGEPVFGTNELVSVTLGPGLVGNIFDGIERPLRDLYSKSGAFIKKGSDIESLDSNVKWDVEILVSVGDEVYEGQVFAKTKETEVILHKVMVPIGINGKVTNVSKKKSLTIKDTLVTIIDKKGQEHKLTMMQKWPIKTARPVKKRLSISRPLVSGQRVIDTLFPVAKGGTAALPGGFGTGKTMLQHQFAKWCDADLIVYVGCGERGNEMTQVLDEFSKLIDPKTNRPLMDRTILIANTSNMPVAAREASIYTGVAIAEYYRDMGYHVAIMADSTSRWAEALREISGRLEEMPAEEGFPAYLSSRLASFYERAGYMKTLNDLEGSVTIIGAVSPQGADFSEPVTQNTKRFVRCFWGLDKALAYERHYPAVNWDQSYSDYIVELSGWYERNVGVDFLIFRREVMKLLAEESKLLEIVKLIGSDVLPDDQKLIIEIGKVIRDGFLQQNSFHKEDTYVPLAKQMKMMEIILYLYNKSRLFVEEGKALSMLLKSGIFEEIIKIKYVVPNSSINLIDDYKSKIDSIIKGIK